MMNPGDLLDFIELPVFTRRWKTLGLDAESDLTALQFTMMANPRGGVPIEGTKAIRKLRYVPTRWSTGKSGATRVLYVYFEDFGIILLCMIYAKGEVGTISVAGARQLNKLVVEQERELHRRKTF